MIERRSRVTVQLAGSGFNSGYVATADELVNGHWSTDYDGYGPDPLYALLRLAEQLHLRVIELKGQAKKR